MRRLLLPLVSVLLLGLGCGGPKAITAVPTSPSASPVGAPAQRWDDLVGRYAEGTFNEDPVLAVSLGRHDFDGRVGDFSPAAIEARLARLDRFGEEVSAFDPDTLDGARRFEREYLLANVDAGLFWLGRMREHERNPLFYSGAIDPNVYLTRAYAPLEVRLEAYLKHASEIPRVVGQMKENLRKPLPRTFVDVGLQVFGGLGPYLQKDVIEIFAPVRDDRLKARLGEVTANAVRAVNDAVVWLEQAKATASDEFALGPERFREMLWATERVDTPLARLKEVGEQDLQRNLAAIAAACEQVAPKQPLSACATVVNNDKPKDGPVAAARGQLGALKRFVVEKDLVSIPGTEEARVEEAPPYKRWNQAYIDIPGPYDVGMPSIYYIAPPDPSWSEADRLAYIPGAADLLFISVHEVWPGHFLQFLHANRAERMFGRLFVGYAFAEGWAHYAEELMWEAGLEASDPKVHVGQLLNALLRNVRFLSAIGLHTEGMSVAESERMFREQALQDPGNAKQQAARGTFDPAYLNYTLGKLIIRKLRDDWTAARGGRSAYREFHDRILSFGGPPLPLVRAALMGNVDGLL